MNDNAGGMLKAWLDEICFKFRSIRKHHQSHEWKKQFVVATECLQKSREGLLETGLSTLERAHLQTVIDRYSSNQRLL